VSGLLSIQPLRHRCQQKILQCNSSRANQQFSLYLELSGKCFDSWQADFSAAAFDFYRDQGLTFAQDKIHLAISAKPVEQLDVRNDKLYSNFEPQMEYEAVDLSLNAPTIETVGYTRIRSIVTGQEYIHYEPDLLFAPDSSLIVSAGVSGKAAYREPPENAKDRFGGNIRDPRRFYGFAANEKLWETLSKQRTVLLENSNITIAGHPHISIAEIDLNGHKQYHITSAYRTSQDDESKYVTVTLVLDSSVDYNIIKYEMINQDIPRISVNLAYEKINYIFIPTTYSRILKDSKGRCVFDSQITLTSSIIRSHPKTLRRRIMIQPS